DVRPPCKFLGDYVLLPPSTRTKRGLLAWMRFRTGLWIAIAAALISGGVAAAPFDPPFEPSFYRHFTGQSQATLGVREVFDAMSPLLRSTRGVLMQAHVKFFSVSGQPIEVSRLRLNYRVGKGHQPESCILSTDSSLCSVIQAPDELVWRVA